MLNITDSTQEQKIPALFRLGFRPLFLCAGIFAVMVVMLWGAVISGNMAFAPAQGALWWHAHEMIFGFACAVIVGFLLTAVQTWTGQLGLRGWPLFGLWFIWLIARVLLILNLAAVPEWIVIMVDLLFLPLAAFLLARPIVKVKQYRNLFFIPVLLLLSVCNLLTYVAPLSHGAYAAILLITLVMTVMGGRVIPFFTANACQFEKPAPIKSIELMSLVSVWLIALGFLLNLHAQREFNVIFALLFTIAGFANLLRWLRWKFIKTLPIPLLWSLHLSYLFIPITFLTLAWHFATERYPLGSILHGLTAGAMGSMILAMMSRVSLGHSGRPLKVSPLIPSAFVAVIVAGFIRLLSVFGQADWYLTSTYVSAALWCYGFAVFSFVYWPVLTRPRLDGRPG